MHDYFPGADQFCNRLLHNYGFLPGFGQSPHLFEIAL
jgi:hypothetical protein